MSFFLIVRRYAPFTTFGLGFEGDVRKGASTSSTATARTIGVVSFDSRHVLGYCSFSSGSEFFGAGKWLTAKIGKHYSTVKSKVTDIKIDPKGTGLSFIVHTAGSNPLIPIIAPDIDTFVDLKVNFFGTYNRYEGNVRGDSFPNAEVFIDEPDGKKILLFDFRTAGGRDTGPSALFGNHSGDILGTFDVNSVKNRPPLPCPITKGN